jgi:hypothetical protein
MLGFLHAVKVMSSRHGESRMTENLGRVVYNIRMVQQRIRSKAW